ncbi:VOC family protein [Rummeliibacillus suwonensis]|uniref:VOC family protein n=1 Tax=Rummeliibacillus suwonensis TaxID=1306154 RepID=UPI001AAECD94|nr:VOC family protein [Rummeliibacillus suwonensis]MBO2536961.1 VOC family protein [Rummeliibacillus suwonensis]
MIEGIFEVHLPVRNLKRSIEFYKRLDLEFSWRDEETAFFWIEDKKSQLGLWEGKEVDTPYHPSLRHMAFRVSYEGLKNSVKWLNSIGIAPVPFSKGRTADPFIRPWSGHGSVYFQDPDVNSLELMCTVEVPEKLKNSHAKLSIDEWEESINDVVE